MLGGGTNNSISVAGGLCAGGSAGTWTSPRRPGRTLVDTMKNGSVTHFADKLQYFQKTNRK